MDNCDFATFSPAALESYSLPSSASSLASSPLASSDLSVLLPTASLPQALFLSLADIPAPASSLAAFTQVEILECDCISVSSSPALSYLPAVLDLHSSCMDWDVLTVSHTSLSVCLPDSAHVHLLPSSSGVLASIASNQSVLPVSLTSSPSGSSPSLSRSLVSDFGEPCSVHPPKKRLSISCSPLGRQVVTSKTYRQGISPVEGDSCFSNPIFSPSSFVALHQADHSSDVSHVVPHDVSSLEFPDFCPRSALVMYTLHSAPPSSMASDAISSIVDSALSMASSSILMDIPNPSLVMFHPDDFLLSVDSPMDDVSVLGSRKRKTSSWGDTDSEYGSASREAVMFSNSPTVAASDPVLTMDAVDSASLELSVVSMTHDSLIMQIVDRTRSYQHFSCFGFFHHHCLSQEGVDF